MGERLTKEREAEIRRVVDKMGFHPTPALVRALLAEIDALRAAPPTTYLHADGTEEPIGELVARLTRERDEAIAKRDATAAVLMRQAERAERAEARVRELEAERQALVDAVFDRDEQDPGHEVADSIARIDVLYRMDAGSLSALDHAARAEHRARQAEADLAETRAQLARLREAAEDAARDLTEHVADGDCAGPHGTSRRGACGDCRVALHLRAALSTPGPTLAEIRRAAQVEVLREMAAATSARGDAHAEDFQTAAAAECFEVADYIYKRADDLEAGSE